MGKVKVPSRAMWGASTQRAIDNFKISGRRFPRPFIKALALIKKAAAETNGELGLVEGRVASAVARAADRIARGEHYDEFPLDVFQTGSGTSTNMNANEVIARLAEGILNSKGLGGVHPNDHVNLCQSSNDVIPSAIHLSAAVEVKENLLPALDGLTKALRKKSREFDGVMKIGRTHLMDAMPVRLGQEFGGWARQCEMARERVGRAMRAMAELALGGTAVGTGFASHPAFAKKACARLSRWTKLRFRPAENPFEALSSHGPCVEMSGAVKAAAISMARISEDIRLLASGPRLGFREITLPALQPGSSMMPGKVNPVIPEAVIQVATQVAANDLAVSMAAQGGHLELSTQLPVLASNLLESIEILSGAAKALAGLCVSGIAANEEVCRRDVERSLALATALAPRIGYARAAEVAKEAARTGRTVRETAIKLKAAGEAELASLLEVRSMTVPGIARKRRQ